MPRIPLIGKQRHNRIWPDPLKTFLLFADLNLWYDCFSWDFLRLRDYLELLYLLWVMFLFECSFLGRWELVGVDVFFLGRVLLIMQEIFRTKDLERKPFLPVLHISIQKTHFPGQLILRYKLLSYESIFKVHFRTYFYFLEENAICVLLVDDFPSGSLRMEEIISDVEQIL
jgi:hypothetical protein